MKKHRTHRYDRLAIFKRDRFQCQHCGRIGTAKELHVDHVEPHALGGSDEESNLATACVNCNIMKGAQRIIPKLWACVDCGGGPVNLGEEGLRCPGCDRKVHRADCYHGHLGNNPACRPQPAEHIDYDEWAAGVVRIGSLA